MAHLLFTHEDGQDQLQADQRNKERKGGRERGEEIGRKGHE